MRSPRTAAAVVDVADVAAEVAVAGPGGGAGVLACLIGPWEHMFGSIIGSLEHAFGSIIGSLENVFERTI